jgi:hypothetical protein
MNMPIIVRLATKADLSNRSAAVALRDFEPLMTAVGHKRTPRHRLGMSTSPLKADMRELTWHVR